MKKKKGTLTSEELEQLKENHDVLSFNNDFHLVYEKQVPPAGVAVIEGQVEITKNKEAREKHGPGTVLGVHHIIKEEPVKYGCKLKKDSKVILLGKSEIVDSMTNHNSHLFRMLKEHLGDEA